MFYSCGLRRCELMQVRCEDVNIANASVIVKHGKGNKERYLPIVDCALMWLSHYLENARDQLTSNIAERFLFLTDYGERFNPNQLSQLVKKYMPKAGIEVNGSCHLLRCAMATHMLDNGADIRFIQSMRGHEDLTSTEIHTHVSIEKLREVHRMTHPSKVRH